MCPGQSLTNFAQIQAWTEKENARGLEVQILQDLEQREGKAVGFCQGQSGDDNADLDGAKGRSVLSSRCSKGQGQDGAKDSEGA